MTYPRVVSRALLGIFLSAVLLGSLFVCLLWWIPARYALDFYLDFLEWLVPIRDILPPSQEEPVLEGGTYRNPPRPIKK